MRLRDLLSVSFHDLPSDARACVGSILRRDGVEASKATSFDSGKPIFANADDDAAAVKRAVAGRNLRYLLVLEGRSLLGLIDGDTLKEMTTRRQRLKEMTIRREPEAVS